MNLKRKKHRHYDGFFYVVKNAKIVLDAINPNVCSVPYAFFPKIKTNSFNSKSVCFVNLSIVAVLLSGCYTKIRSSVVVRNAVNMVDKFIRFQRSTKHSFHDKSMHMNPSFPGSSSYVLVSSLIAPRNTIKKIFVDFVDYTFQHVFSIKPESLGCQALGGVS